MTSPSPRPFNQTERITARLHDLVRSYPKDLGLIKEFLQNADDAGASILHVIFDRQTHPGKMDNSEQEIVLGPALLFVNDRTFAEKDINSIQLIGGGGKLNDAGGIGRFGQGFNTCFSVSDHPSLLTGDWVVWFDPHHRAHGADRNAWAWSVTDVNQCWPAWAATFTSAGHSLDSSRFEGTVFRLPIRNEPEAHRSEIIREPFLQSDFESILKEVSQAGPALLVFLRSVRTLRIDEIGIDGILRQRFFLETANPEEVDRARSQIRLAVHGDPATLLDEWLLSTNALPQVTFKHMFRTSIEGQVKECAWFVVTGLFRGPENLLLVHARAVCSRNEKALPWAGAAAPLDGSPGLTGLACFLPLPESSPWPVLLHGWFDLDSARRRITRQAGTGETAQARMDWNRALLQYAVGPASALLVESLCHDAAMTPDPYSRWILPTSAQDDYDRKLVRGFYAELGALKVFRCINAGGIGWYSLADAAAEKIVNVGQAWHHVLREPLIAGGYTLIEPPLPGPAIKALLKSSYPAPELTTEMIQEETSADVDVNCDIQEAPWKALHSPQWVISLARFCGESSLSSLAGLSLALLADGRLHTFGKCGPILLVTDLERALLAALPYRMLAPEFQDALHLYTPEATLGVEKLEIAMLVDCVREILRMGQPREEWLILLFDYLEQLPMAVITSVREHLKKLQLIPDDQGKLWKMGFADTPMLVNGEAGTSEYLLMALQKLGVPRVSGSEALIEAIQRFSSRHSNLVFVLSPNRVATAFSSHVATPWIDLKVLAKRDVLAPVLDYLSPPTWLQKNDTRVDSLRRLRMLPMLTGALAAADVQDLYIPGGFQPPSNIEVRHSLLDCGEDGQWIAFYRALRVPELNGFAYIVSGILPMYADQTAEAKIEILRWLRDNMRSIEVGLEADMRTRLRAEIRKTAILPLKGGGMGTPRQAFRPDSEAAIELLGDVARIPDLILLDDEPKRWSSFFIELDLLSSPQPEHLLAAIRLNIECDNRPDSDARQRLSALREYITNHWDGLTSNKQAGASTFAQELASLAWLSVVMPSPEVAGVAAWPLRLYQPTELVPLRLLDLVASVHPVADTFFPEEMSKALGIRTQVPLTDVLQHFSVIRAMGLVGDVTVASRARVKSFVAFLQFIAGLPDATWALTLGTLNETPCVLVRDRWWLPRQVFLESLPFSTEWCVSVLEDPDLSGRPSLTKGLTRLGVRPKPESSDWVMMLNDQHRAVANRPLEDSEIAQAHGALQQLRVENREWLRGQSIPVPTATHHLHFAHEVLLPDDPRLKRLSPLCPLPLVEETEIVLDIARMAGARSLRQVLEDELTDDPVPTQETTLLQWAHKRTEACRSPQFYEALRRLAWHEAVVRGDDDPAACAADEKLTLARGLTVLVARSLRITSAFRDSGEIVFEQQASSFWDSLNAIVWLSEGSERRMGDNLARTLATMCEVDPLRVSRLLDVTPEEVEKLLDDDDVACIPSGEQGSLPPTWTAPEHFEDTNSVREDDGHVSEDNTAFDVPPDGDGRPKNQPTGSTPWSPPRGPLTQEPPASDVQGDGSDDAISADEPENPTSGGPGSRAPGFGSSRPWKPDAPRPSPTSDRRLRSYAHREPLGDYDTGRATVNEDDPVRAAAVQRVIEWEHRQGRTATPVSGSALGYNLLSVSEDGERKIRVIGIDGAWTARGVGVSYAELANPLRSENSWWLYVVEYARASSDALIHPIPNPFRTATEYRFDSGWRSAEAAELSDDPHEGETIFLNDGVEATVVQTEQRGRFWSVIIRLSDGTEEPRIWHPSWRRN